MNGEVHPRVTKQSQAEANAEFDAACVCRRNVGSVTQLSVHVSIT
jgi:hypothetical protein